MSSDRETRKRLEEVQTRLVELGPELELTESPGFAEQVQQLERTVDLASQRTARAEERLALARTELSGATLAVEELTLAAQAKQTDQLPDWLAMVLLVGLLFVGIGTAIGLARSRGLSPPIGVALCLASAFALGVTLRARVRRRPSHFR